MSWNIMKEEVKEQEIKEVPKIEFKKLSEARKDRGLKILSYGNFSTGKTHFALSSNNPIFVIDTENGAAPLANKFPDANVVNISNIDNDNVEEKDEVRNFENYMSVIDYICSLPDEEVGTVVIDSVSDIWDWAQAYAKVKIFKIKIEDRLKQQFDWGTINKIYKKQLQKLIDKNCNVILTAREGEIYDGPGKPSGRYTPKCMKQTPYMTDFVLYHQTKFINKQIQFSAKIEKSRHKGELVGKEISDITLNKLKELLL